MTQGALPDARWHLPATQDTLAGSTLGTHVPS
jgi:hypothetical protein